MSSTKTKQTSTSIVERDCCHQPKKITGKSTENLKNNSTLMGEKNSK